MDIYPMVLLGLALILLAVSAGAVYSVVSRKKAFNAIVAKNAAATPKPLNFEDWQAKRIAANQRKAIAEFQELKELNADFSAIISGE